MIFQIKYQIINVYHNFLQFFYGYHMNYIVDNQELVELYEVAKLFEAKSVMDFCVKKIISARLAILSSSPVGGSSSSWSQWNQRRRVGSGFNGFQSEWIFVWVGIFANFFFGDYELLLILFLYIIRVYSLIWNNWHYSLIRLCA